MFKSEHPKAVRGWRSAALVLALLGGVVAGFVNGELALAGSIVVS
jgi:hypothetical protein